MPGKEEDEEMRKIDRKIWSHFQVIQLYVQFNTNYPNGIETHIRFFQTPDSGPPYGLVIILPNACFADGILV